MQAWTPRDAGPVQVCSWSSGASPRQTGWVSPGLASDEARGEGAEGGDGGEGRAGDRGSCSTPVLSAGEGFPAACLRSVLRAMFDVLSKLQPQYCPVNQERLV